MYTPKSRQTQISYVFCANESNILFLLTTVINVVLFSKGLENVPQPTLSQCDLFC